MDNQNNDWQTPAHRQSIVERIDEAMQSAGGPIQRSGTELENTVFQKARSRDDYMNYVTKLILHCKNAKNKKPDTMPPDPINALQNLASQGTRQMPSQMMPMAGGAMTANNVPPNSTVLQNLIHQRAGQQPMQGMGNMQGVRGGPGGPVGPGGPGGPGGSANQQQVMSGNLPLGAMNANAMGINNVIGPQQGNAAAQMQNNMVNQMNQMNQIGGQMPMNVQGGQINPNVMQMNINQAMPPNQMNANLNQAMPPNQMSQLMGRINAPPNMTAHQAGPIGGHTPQMMNQMANSTPTSLPNAQQPNLIPNQQLPVIINQPTGPPNQIAGPGQMNLNQMLNPMSHMGRNQAPNVYQVRNATPNQPYFRKSPSPSAPSPMGATLPSQMVPSPALVPSPQVAAIATRNVMAPSPSSTNLNTPGQTGAAPSPLNAQEEQLYREKYRQLTKYIEPLKKMVARIGNDDEKLLKMNKLLEILSNPNQRIPLETLMKCEIALEKMDLKSYSMTPVAPTVGSKEHHMNNALLEAVSANLQSPIGNHTLQRTFRPCLEALFGPDIKNIPPTKQPRLASATAESRTTQYEIPHLIQGEIARLDHKFKITFDPSSHSRSKTIKLLCSIDDSYLPCVPPIFVAIPEDYPSHSPNCNLLGDEYNATPFLASVQNALNIRISKLPKPFSLSHLLDTWEMAIRQACSPDYMSTNTTASVLLGM